MGNDVFQLKTDDVLLDALKKAASVKQSANDLKEQRISFVFGSLDSKSGVTKEQVRKIIAEQEGCV